VLKIDAIVSKPPAYAGGSAFSAISTAFIKAAALLTVSFKFGAWHRVRDDPCTGLNFHFATFENKRADSDARVHVS
jgi:hypothetical protein